MSNGKGDKPRPIFSKEFSKNWDKVFKKKKATNKKILDDFLDAEEEQKKEELPVVNDV